METDTTSGHLTSMLSSYDVSPRPHSPFPQVMRISASISKGIKTLENFGFKTSLTHSDPSALRMYHTKAGLGFHVSDLWSQRQQQEFLKAMNLQRAQLARERQAHFINYLVESKKKLKKDVSEADLLIEIAKEMQTDTMAKYRHSEKSKSPLLKKSLSESSSVLRSMPPSFKAPGCTHLPAVPVRKQVFRLETFITHCNSTLKTFKKAHEKLAEISQASKDKGKTPESVFLDSARSLQLSGKRRFANSLRR